MILHTTKKLADKLKKGFEISPKPLALPDDHNGLGEWHANLITIQRRNCLLFIHNQTRFSVIIPGVKAKLTYLCNRYLPDFIMNAVVDRIVRSELKKMEGHNRSPEGFSQ